MDRLARPYTFLLLFYSCLLAAQYQPSSLDITGLPTLDRELQEARHKTLSTVMQAAQLEELLLAVGPFTIFAPSEQAFKELSREKLLGLLQPGNQKELRSMLTYHILAGKFTASKILRALCRGEGTATFTTIQGNEILARMEGMDILLTDCAGNTAKITTADSRLQNGVIHVIDKVIRPN